MWCWNQREIPIYFEVFYCCDAPRGLRVKYSGFHSGLCVSMFIYMVWKMLSRYLWLTCGAISKANNTTQNFSTLHDWEDKLSFCTPLGAKRKSMMNMFCSIFKFYAWQICILLPVKISHMDNCKINSSNPYDYISNSRIFWEKYAWQPRNFWIRSMMVVNYIGFDPFRVQWFYPHTYSLVTILRRSFYKKENWCSKKRGPILEGNNSLQYC